RYKPVLNGFSVPVARMLCRLVFISFVIKIVLQAATVIPDLGHAVFGLRPIIIGFLHLVFLGLASFYILSEYTERGILQPGKILAGSALKGFVLAVIAQESVLLIQGGGLLFGRSNPVYNWILWGLSIFLFIFALLMSISAIKNQQQEFEPKRNS
ncbi:MAG TPA: hypothetical protein VFX73_06645, partial [Chitinophagaceae bacterium]|nr:hypothetical protein [Chitinophagaceae bacterium]